MNTNSNQSGLADSEVNIVDLSFLIQTGLKGIVAVIGTTERGVPNDPENGLVGSWTEYKRKFGGLIPESIFPYLCKMALDGGGTLRVSSAGHYTDVDDAATYTGVNAAQTASVNVGTVPAPIINSVVLTATQAGNWAHSGNLSVIINAAVSGDATKVDIHVRIAGFPELDKDVYDVTKIIGTPEKTLVNSTLGIVTLGTMVGALPIGTFNAFTGGDRHNASVVADDYIGSVTSQIGLHSFDGQTDFTKLMIPEVAITEVDDAIDSYQRLRGDFIGVLRTPTGLTGDQCVAYRNRTGSYTGVAIDNAFMFMFTGGVKRKEPLTGNIINMSELGDVAGVCSNKDSKFFEWMSFSGSKRGVIRNGVLGVAYDFGTPARAVEAANVNGQGINCIVKNEFGVVLWGNNSLQKAPTLLKKSEVSELLMYLKRTFNPTVRRELFDPNDPETWQAIYKNIKKIMDAVKGGRGVYKWLYQGDQDILDINDAVINLPATRDAGKYIFNLYVAPTPALTWITINVIVTNSDVDYTVAMGATQQASV